ncbi:2-methylcitrate dehydratase PrpD [Comamonas sp. BIGb0124]|uniref:MmgE/PrpD family protein n=1 Tax=Comamonas sp. BIGb0124 TaxID=2485130 RepID=UPI000F49BC5A|nr:MmgE/PrpD family protein [Comamonas sp. BIGb0124]ROR20219.1 2-methylcitrate dehydratase PrpD [Comamonas sp. BIGb0124]
MPDKTPDGAGKPPAASHSHGIAQAVTKLRYDDLPAEVVKHAKRLIVDTLVVAAAGAGRAGGTSSRALRTAVPAAPGRSKPWFLRQPAGVHAVDATFVNTLHAAALDFDSLNRAVHADLVCLPAAWSMAEASGAGGRDFIAAYVAGSELVSRWSRAAQGPSKGWSGTSLYGGLGAAVAAGKLMQLPDVTLRHAIGLACSQAAGTQQANVEQVLSKRLQPALAARQGVFAAHLAASGASAPEHALEGRFGLRALTQPGDDSQVLDGLWQQWQFLDTGLKAYPVCACSHAAIEACLSLRARYRLNANDIASLTATVSPFMARLVGAAFSRRGDAQVTAQFSLRYHLACCLVHGRIGLDQIEPQALDDPRVLPLIERIRIDIDPLNTAELAPASVSIVLQGGREVTARCEQVVGGSEAPLTDEALFAKWTDCGARAETPLSADDLHRLVEQVDRLERIQHMDRLPSGLEGLIH